MRVFDIEARKLNPDIFISGRDTLDGKKFGVYKSNYLPTYNTSGGGEKTGRQITKDGVKSIELRNLNLGSDIDDFALSCICMPTEAPKHILTSNLFNLSLSDFNRYKIETDEVVEFLPFDSTCHYLYVRRSGTSLTIIIDSHRYTFELPDDTISTLTGFQGHGAVLIDKFMFSRNSEVMQKEYYDQLNPATELTSIDIDSYMEWVFSYDTINPRVFTYTDAEMIDGSYIVPVTGLEGESNTIRNLSRGPIEVSYDAGQNWVSVITVEKIAPLISSVVVRSDDKDFEFVLDAYDGSSINLPGVAVEIDGPVYPYHRDEPTYYTNAKYDFNNASVHIAPIDDYQIKSIWLYGRLSRSILDDINVINIYRDGKAIPPSDIEDESNRLYLIVVDSTGEIVLNPSKNKSLSINALGVSEITNEVDQVQQAFNLFAKNIVVSYAEETGNIQPGSITEDEESFRIIDVQWTI